MRRGERKMFVGTEGGKVNVAGLQSMADVRDAIQQIYRHLDRVTPMGGVVTEGAVTLPAGAEIRDRVSHERTKFLNYFPWSPRPRFFNVSEVPVQIRESRILILMKAQRLQYLNTSRLKINLTPPDGVVRLFKMLTYYIYAALFHRLMPCQRARSFF